MSHSRCFSQENFRSSLIKRDQQCILSGLAAEVCEAAHIMNKEWLETNSKEIKFTKQNGILLNSCLHREFDKHFWTVDIDTQIDTDKDTNEFEITCNIKLYPPAEKKKRYKLKLAIFEYNTITISRGCIPFFKERNKYVEQKIYNPNVFTCEDIQKHIKDEFNSHIHTQSTRKSKPTSSLKRPKLSKRTNSSKRTKSSKPTKKKRLSKETCAEIEKWIKKYKSSESKPTKEERERFSTANNISPVLFESRFTQYWRKYS